MPNSFNEKEYRSVNTLNFYIKNGQNGLLYTTLLLDGDFCFDMDNVGKFFYPLSVKPINKNAHNICEYVEYLSKSTGVIAAAAVVGQDEITWGMQCGLSLDKSKNSNVPLVNLRIAGDAMKKELDDYFLAWPDAQKLTPQLWNETNKFSFQITAKKVQTSTTKDSQVVKLIKKFYKKESGGNLKSKDIEVTVFKNGRIIFTESDMFQSIATQEAERVALLINMPCFSNLRF
ncbi:hypothetical protein C9J21_17840 [Photobacterium phosphoreum]|uniref:hypothetical protein n=1 Tax=Photobacterium phosphoreum TaxID=659 RepID=UPI000D1741C1|nr:hypothetical protein [Photobacterium phosphoreum]PSW31211.1 hypothetical protein C9J21_17840 [Photobacterium phosphoreum]